MSTSTELNGVLTTRPAKGRGNVGRERVMEVATQMFLRYGYSGTSMKALAVELGVSAPAIYWYFSSKEDLYVEVIETSMRDFTTFVQSAATADDPSTRLGQLVRAHVIWQLDQSDAARTFNLSRAQADEVPLDRLEVVRDLQIKYRDQIRQILQDGRDRGQFHFDNVNVTAFGVITLCEYVYSWFNPNGKLSSTEVAELLVALVRNMVGATS